MTATPDKPDAFEQLMETYAQELLDMTDDDILDGANAEAIKATELARLDAFKVEAGRRRLALAREKVQLRAVLVDAEVSVADARAYLRQAANDPRYTLAARELDEMSDADLLMLYHRLKTLEADDKPDAPT